MDLNIPPSRDDPNITEKEARRASLCNRSQLDANGEPAAGPTQPSFNLMTTDPTTELTEDDIFRMKKLATTPSEVADQSAASVADSSSIGNDAGVDDGETVNGGSVDGDAAISAAVREEVKMREMGDDVLPPQLPRNYIVSGDYVFGRHRPVSPQLNRETVTALTFPFEPLIIPGIEDPNEYRKCFSQSKVYIVGTAHFSPDSKHDVLNTIQVIQPDIVMVELCSSRISILSMDEEMLLREAKSLNREKVISIIRQSGLVQGILHVLLLSTSAHITRELGMAPGGEFRAAHTGSLQVPNCRLVLGDRPLQITLQRALNSLSMWQKIRLFFQILISNRTSITQEDVERCKNKDLLEELLKEMAGEFPQLSRIFVDERDQYITHILHSLLQRTSVEKWNASRIVNAKYEPVNIVAVVGIGHVSGIVANWNRHIDGAALLTLPKVSKREKAVKFFAKALFYGACIYGTYKLGKFTWHRASAFHANWQK